MARFNTILDLDWEMKEALKALDRRMALAQYRDDESLEHLYESVSQFNAAY